MSERTLLLLARAGDPAIESLRQLLPQQLVHVRPAELSSSGWSCVVGHPELAAAAAGGRVLHATQIAAVVCRIHSITPADVAHLHSEDREFAAGEMHAFLRAWLSQFGERSCNLPDSTSLAGPAWLPMRWRWLAGRLGIPSVAPAATAEQGETTTVLVAGNEALGTRDATLLRHALRMARAVHSTLLSVRFVQQRFDSADPCPLLDAQGAAALSQWAFALPQPRAAAPGAR